MAYTYIGVNVAMGFPVSFGKHISKCIGWHRILVQTNVVFFGIVLVCNVNPTVHKPGDSSAVVDGPLPKQRPEETLGSWKFDFDFPTG